MKKWPTCQREVEQDYSPMKKPDQKPVLKPVNLHPPKNRRRKVDQGAGVRPRLWPMLSEELLRKLTATIAHKFDIHRKFYILSSFDLKIVSVRENCE